MKRIIFSLLILVIIVFIGYNYLYQDHRNIAGEKSEYKIEAVTLAREFLDQPDEAVAKYMDKTLSISGKVTELETGGVTINNVVYGEFIENDNGKAALDKKITIKGRCIGYDELLEIVKLDQCIIIN